LHIWSNPRRETQTDFDTDFYTDKHTDCW